MIGDEGSVGVFFGKLWIGFGDELNNFGGIPLNEELGGGRGSGGVVNIAFV